jgi:formylglycine-generating enzyme required for sulfatase activity
MKNPIEDKKGSIRVFRGGSWNYLPEDVRTSRRSSIAPAGQYDDLGFRIVRNIPKDKK